MSFNVLNVQTSVFGDEGASSHLNSKVISALADQHGDIKVVDRNLTRKPLPYYDAEYINALSAPKESLSEAQRARLALGEKLIEELESADALVIAAPMYNFGVPAQLKTWLDYVARAGRTFRYTSRGPEGLLADRPVYITATRGGQYAGKPSDSQTPFLQTFFNFIGLKDLRFVFAEGLNMGLKDESLASAETNIEQWVKQNA